MNQFSTCISVPSGFVCYLQALINYGVISFDATGKIQVNKVVRGKLNELHKEVAAGDAVIADNLDKALDLALNGQSVASSI